MKCKKIQELLLTDYIDAEADDALKDEVDKHVKRCPACKQFKQDLLTTAIEPLRKAHERKSSDLVWNHDSVWNHIKDALEKEAVISEEKRRSGFLPNLRDYLPHVRNQGRLFSVPKPALALAGGLVIALVLFITMSRSNNGKVVSAYPEKQIEYLARVIGGSEYSSPEENNGYGTAIEEYFF